MLSDLNKIKLGTIDDLLESSNDYHAGITLRYIKDRVGANTVWLMPVFPNNDRWNIPDALRQSRLAVCRARLYARGRKA